MTSDTSGAGTTNPSGAHEFTSTFSGVRDKGNNKITELRTILQRESQNS